MKELSKDGKDVVSLNFHNTPNIRPIALITGSRGRRKLSSRAAVGKGL